MALPRPFERDVFHQGDCAHMAALPDDVIDLVVAGPPYWNLIDYSAYSRGEERWWREGGSYDAFLEQLKAWFTEVFRVLRPGRYCAVNLGTVRHESETKPLPFDAVRFIERAGFTFSWEIVWHKPAGGRRAARNFYRKPFAGSFIPNNVVEYVLVFKKSPDVPFATRSGLLADVDNAIVTDEVFRREISNNVWHLMPVSGEREHPCPFPPEIPLRLISLLSLKGETVLDPFMGSGTTARAARTLGRHFVGYEAQEAFVELARRVADRPLKARRALLLNLDVR